MRKILSLSFKILFVGLVGLFLINWFNPKVEAQVLSGSGTLEDPYLIDSEDDFINMNGSSAHFKMVNTITITSTSLGIETFDGVFEGGGYSIKNLNGMFVTNLTGEINNVVIESPQTFTASLDISESKHIGLGKYYYGYLVSETSTSIWTKPQYFGYVSGTVVGGVINNVRVTNATINTNSSTRDILTGTNKTASMIGFVAGNIKSDSIIKNCTVDNSTLIYSTCYAVGGIVGYSSNSTITGCLTTNLTITTKDGVELTSMPKAFVGLIAGEIVWGYLEKCIVTDINSSSVYLSVVGCITSNNNGQSRVNVRDIYYDETVAAFSTNHYDDATYEKVLVSEDPHLTANASSSEYGHIYDYYANSSYPQYIFIYNINEYDGTSTASIINDFNEIVEIGKHVLTRSDVTTLPAKYVAAADRKIAVNYNISPMTIGDLMIDKISYSIDEANTNCEASIRFLYKWNEYTSFESVKEDTVANKLAGEWKIVAKVDTIDIIVASGQLNVEPFNIENAYFAYTQERKYNGYEHTTRPAAFTEKGGLSLDVELSGDTTATEVGSYEVIAKGTGIATGTVTLPWTIIKGTATSITASNVTTIYDGNFHNIEVSGVKDGSTVFYSMDEQNYSTTLPEIKNAGTYTVYCKVTNPNYEDFYSSATVTINQRTVSITWGETQLEYNGKPQFPEVTLGNIVSGDTVYITSKTGEATEVKTTFYTAKITGINDPNYKLPSSTTKYYYINPKKIDYLEIEDKVYNGQVQYADIPTEGYVASGNYGWTDVGEYKITISPGKNYEWMNGGVANIAYTFKITKATNEWIVKPSIEGWVYGDDPNEVVYEALFNSVSVMYRLKGTEQTSKEVPTNAGTYEAIVSTLSNPNISNVITETLEFTIEKINPTYQLPTNVTAVYGTLLKDVVIETESAGTWVFVDELTTVGDVGINVFKVNFVPNDVVNYNRVEEEINITVLKADIAYTAPLVVDNLVYNNTNQALITEGSAVGFIIEYKVDDGAWQIDLPTGLDAKEYTIYYRILGNNNYNPVEESLNVRISPKELSVESISLKPVHIGNDYQFELEGATFTEEIKTEDFKVINFELSDNLVGTQNIKVYLELLNSNYVLLNNEFTTTVEIQDHEQELDDNDCTTSVTCKYCDYVFVEALEHDLKDEYQKDETHHWHECQHEGCESLEKEKHEYGDWVIIKEATQKEPGLKQKECVCGAIITEQIPQLPPSTSPIVFVVISISALIVILLLVYWFILRKKFIKK